MPALSNFKIISQKAIILISFFKESLSDKGKLIENFLSLSTLQVVNQLLPLLTFPYLVRVLGVETFGLLVFVKAITHYLNLFISYGFDLSATDEISKNESDELHVSQVFSSIFLIKAVFVGICFLIPNILLGIHTKFSEHSTLYQLAFLIVIGQAMFPTWYFQGIQNMKFITLISTVAKVFFTMLVFVTVKEQSDIGLAIFLESIGHLVAGIIAITICIKKFGIQLTLPRRNMVYKQLKLGFHIFLSQLLVGFYDHLNIILLGAMTSNTVVGTYAIASKIAIGIGSLSQPINGAIYPHMSELYATSRKSYKAFVKKSFTALSVLFPFIGMITAILSNLLVAIVAGKPNPDAAFILKVLSIFIAFYPFGGFFTQMLVIQNLRKNLLYFVFSIAMINLVIVYPFIYHWEAVGLALVMVILICAIFIIKGLYLYNRLKV